MCRNYYFNQTILTRVITKNVGILFRDTVYISSTTTVHSGKHTKSLILFNKYSMTKTLIRDNNTTK